MCSPVTCVIYVLHRLLHNLEFAGRQATAGGLLVKSAVKQPCIQNVCVCVYACVLTSRFR